MGLRKSKHTVNDLKYHLVWIPKYRKHILVGEVAEYAKGIFHQIAEEYGFWIDTVEVMEDHVHIFLEVPPKYSPAEVIQIMKSISAREMFRKFRQLRKKFWAGELWSDGYFVRSVGDKVTADMIRQYIEYQAREESTSQLKLFG